MFRVTKHLLAAVVAIAAIGAAACSDDSPPADGTSEASSTATATVDALPQLTSGLGDLVENEELADGTLVMRWLVAGPSAEGVASDLAARVAEIPGLALTVNEVTDRGGVVAFEGTRSGHYLVTRSTGQGTPVELRLDPTPSPEVDATGTTVPLPEGFPLAEVPIFPGAKVQAAESVDLGDGLVQFNLSLRSTRTSIEVLGYYADLFGGAGWDVTTKPGVIEVHGSGRVTTVWVREVPGEPSSAILEVVQRSGTDAP